MRYVLRFLCLSSMGQLGDLTIEDQAKLSLLAQVIKEPLFTQVGPLLGNICYIM